MKKKYNRIALFCGALALIFAIFSFAGCDSIEDTFHHDSGEEGGGSGINPVESAVFPSSVGNYILTITLTGGTFAPQASLAWSQFTITTPGTHGFTTLTGGRVDRLSNTEVRITRLAAVTDAGSGQKITVAGAALATQATAATVVASGIGGVGLNPVESAAFPSVVGNHTLTITLARGTFMPQTGLSLSQFAITTPGTNGFTNLTGGWVTRSSNTVVTITGLAAVTAAGSGQKITVAAAALASQATSVAVVASGGVSLNPVESAAFNSAIGNHTLTITLTGGAYAAAPILSQFPITTPGTPGFNNLTGGTVTRLSNTVVAITGLSAVTAAGSGQKITVAAAALASQATSVAVVASGGVPLNPVESYPFISAIGNHTLTITLTGGVYAAAPILSQFTITTPGTPGFNNLTGGTVTRTSNTVVTITDLAAVTAAGNNQRITVAAAALASQATAVTVTPSTP
ncbi:hypothetical protein FACS189445_2670 [Spirochaetia bacterium]|nr:hypothetical protein FACS189445_2670 [Spirochaetia bacterium]